MCLLFSLSQTTIPRISDRHREIVVLSKDNSMFLNLNLWLVRVLGTSILHTFTA